MLDAAPPHAGRAALADGPSDLSNRRRPTLPGPCRPSTIGAEGLNCSVRNGKRCIPLAMTTERLRDRRLPPEPQNRTADRLKAGYRKIIRQALGALVPVR